MHGALCRCYSGQCYMSERIAGRSANRGECIQACRSLYDLVDEDGNVLVRNKALLSLKDYNLKDRLKDLAEAGICSFKIEGRLKNISYVGGRRVHAGSGQDFQPWVHAIVSGRETVWELVLDGRAEINRRRGRDGGFHRPNAPELFKRKEAKRGEHHNNITDEKSG